MVAYSSDKPYQKQAIKCALKEVLELPYVLNANIKEVLEKLGDQLARDIDLRPSITQYSRPPPQRDESNHQNNYTDQNDYNEAYTSSLLTSVE